MGNLGYFLGWAAFLGTLDSKQGPLTRSLKLVLRPYLVLLLGFCAEPRGSPEVSGFPEIYPRSGSCTAKQAIHHVGPLHVVVGFLALSSCAATIVQTAFDHLPPVLLADQRHWSATCPTRILPRTFQTHTNARSARTLARRLNTSAMSRGTDQKS